MIPLLRRRAPRRTAGQVAVCLLVAFSLAPAAFGHGDTMVVGSTAAAGGALTIDAAFDLTAPIVTTPSVSIGGQTLYTTEFPSFLWPSADAPPGLFMLPAGTRVRLQVVAIASGASIMLGGTTLDAAGETADIGLATAGEHVHPEWRLVLPDGVVGNYSASFRLTTTAAGFSASQTYAVTITNAVAAPTATSAPPTPTATTTATTTATPTPPAADTASPTPTATPTSLSELSCPSVSSTGCRNAARVSLTLVGAAAPDERRLTWRWARGAATDATELGDSATAFALCLYDTVDAAGVLRASVRIPAATACADPGCWRTTRGGGRVYRGADADDLGRLRLSLAPGLDGRANLSATVSGAMLPALPFAQAPALTVELRTAGGACWQSQLVVPARRNDAGRFIDSIR